VGAWQPVIIGDEQSGIGAHVEHSPQPVMIGMAGSPQPPHSTQLFIPENGCDPHESPANSGPGRLGRLVCLLRPKPLNSEVFPFFLAPQWQVSEWDFEDHEEEDERQELRPPETLRQHPVAAKAVRPRRNRQERRMASFQTGTLPPKTKRFQSAKEFVSRPSDQPFGKL
jgi:hypothetical protein